MIANGEPVMLPPGTIQVEDLVLEYPVYRHLVLDRCRALLGALLPWLNPPFRRVLDRITLAIKPGEVVGIVGLNGAGKTSLLKVIAGLVSPTEGAVRVGGRVMALLAMGVGFRPAFTGRQNLLIGGLLLGLDTRDITERMQEIAEFSELGEALDQPYFTYSSGMRARLAFSLATSVPADIVILDETLATGDARFISKCYRRLKEIRASGRTILFVSHNLGEVARITSRVVLLDRGRVAFDGDVFEGLKAYVDSFAAASPSVTMDPVRSSDLDVSVRVQDEEGQALKVVELGRRIAIEMRIASRLEMGESFVFLRIIRMESNELYAYLSARRWDALRETPTRWDSVYVSAGVTTITWTIPYWTGGEGGYFIDAYVGPACPPESPDVAEGRFWHKVARIESSYGNAYLRGAGSLAELPVEHVTVMVAASSVCPKPGTGERP
ncbi:MAG: ABC transporter ATP-binding protein [Nitrospiraceae bacterium]|nr:MAG: ABC transporter ATP-binding protein [Nitrospiraceae bacterium]